MWGALAALAGFALGRAYFGRVRRLPSRQPLGAVALALVIFLAARLLSTLGPAIGATVLALLGAYGFALGASRRAMREAEDEAVRARAREGFLGALLFGGTMAAIAVVLGGAELVVRWLEPGSFSDGGALRAQMWNEGPCYRVDLSPSGRVLRPVTGSSQWGGERRDLPLARTDGVVRVAVVGESSAGQMEGALDELTPRFGCRLEVLHCATAGGDLRQVERRFHEVLGYSPDVVSVIFGHNLHTRNDAYSRLPPYQWLIGQSALISVVTGRPPTSALIGSVWPDPVDRRRVLRETLMRMAAAARERGVAMTASTMTSNLRFAPLPQMGGPDSSSQRRSSAGAGVADDPRSLEARFLEAAGRPDEAAAQLEALRDEHPGPVAEFELATVLWRAGRTDEARDRFWAALDGDNNRIRATREVNQVIRDAGRDAGFTVRDTVRACTDEAPAHVPGWETLHDHCHLRGAWMEREAVALFESYPQPVRDRCPSVGNPQARDGAARGPGLDHSREGYEDMVSQILWTGGRLLDGWARQIDELVASECTRSKDRVDADVERHLFGAPFARLPVDSQVAVIVAAADGYARGGRIDRALALHQRALGLHASPAAEAGALVKVGEWQLSAGRSDDARAAWERAAKLAPERADARYFLERLGRP
jgi:tetratricopeptide (TPR) repeat protein